MLIEVVILTKSHLMRPIAALIIDRAKEERKSIKLGHNY